MSDDDRDPLADRADDAMDQWVEDVADEAERAADDPFEYIGEGSEPRHGDPFDTFEGADEASAEGATADEASEGNPGSGNPSVDATDPARDGLPSGDADDPFTAFDAPASDPFDEGETVFEDGDRGGVGEDVWERMASTDAEAEAVPGKRYVDVNKHSYCETCEYFSEPPDVACSHEGTEILEFVDMETVRVVDCPVVDERNALEDVD